VCTEVLHKRAAINLVGLRPHQQREDEGLHDLLVDDARALRRRREEPDQQDELEVEVEGQEAEDEVQGIHHDLQQREEAPVRDPHGRVFRLVLGEHLERRVGRVAHAHRRKDELRRAEEEDEEEAEQGAAAGEQRFRLARRLLDLLELLARGLGELDEDLVDLALDGCVWVCVGARVRAVSRAGRTLAVGRVSRDGGSVPAFFRRIPRAAPDRLEGTFFRKTPGLTFNVHGCR
ncbi:unnamed protein product, partial [Pelagomonas calceolata]